MSGYYGGDYYGNDYYSDDEYTYTPGILDDPAEKGIFAMLWLGLVLLVMALVASFFAKWNRRGKRDFLSKLILPAAAVCFIIVYCLDAARTIISNQGATVSIYFLVLYIVEQAFSYGSDLLLSALFILVVLDIVTYRSGKNTGWKIPLIILWVLQAMLSVPGFALYAAYLGKYMADQASPYGSSGGSTDPTADQNLVDDNYVVFGMSVVQLLLAIVLIAGTVASMSGGKTGVVPLVLLASLVFFVRQLMTLLATSFSAFVQNNLRAYRQVGADNYFNVLVANSVLYYLLTGIIMLVLAVVGIAHGKHERNPPPPQQYPQQQQYAPVQYYQQQPYPQQHQQQHMHTGYATVPTPAPYGPYQQQQQHVYSKDNSRVTSPAPDHQELNGHST